MKRFKWFLILSLASAVLIACGEADNRGPVTAKECATYKVAKQCSETLCKRYGLIHCHQTESMMHEPRDIFLAFHIEQALSKEEMRALLINCAHEVIAAVHHDPDIQKHLPFWGFGSQNVRVQIIEKTDSQKLKDSEIRMYTYQSNQLIYETFDLQNRAQHKTSESESYQEALALLKSSSM